MVAIMAPDRPITQPELLTVTQAGAVLGLSKPKAHELASRGVIPTIKTGHHRGRMVRRSDLLALIEQWAAESTATDTISAATPQRLPETTRERRGRK